LKACQWIGKILTFDQIFFIPIRGFQNPVTASLALRKKKRMMRLERKAAERKHQHGISFEKIFSFLDPMNRLTCFKKTNSTSLGTFLPSVNTSMVSVTSTPDHQFSPTHRPFISNRLLVKLPAIY
jgi:hypothetical protein